MPDAQKMDERTRRELSRISSRVPLRLAQNVTKEVVDTSQEDILKSYLKSPKLSKRTKAIIEKGIRDGKFRSSDVVEDPNVVAELDKYHTDAIRKATRAGKLADPRKDKFLRNRQRRMRERGMTV